MGWDNRGHGLDAHPDVDTTSTAPTDGQALVWDDANSEWVPGDAGSSSPLTTKGDLYTHDGSADARLPVGSDGRYLKANSTATNGIEWADPPGAYAETIGDGSATSFTVTHNLGTEDVHVQVWDVSGTDPVLANGDPSSVEATDTNTVTVTFGSAPSTDQYRIVVLASGASGGSGGKSYVTLPGLKPPDTSDADDVEFLDQSNGTDPTTIMSWFNQGTSTADLRGGRLHIVPQSGGGSHSFRGLAVAAPTGDFTADTMLHWRHVFGGGASDDIDLGIVAIWGTLSSPTALIYSALVIDSGTVTIGSARHTAFDGGFAATNQTINIKDPHTVLVGLDWDSSGTSMQARFSFDPLGYEWHTLTADTSQAGDPDFVGLYVSDRNGVGACGHFRFLRFNWTADFDPTTDN